MDKTIEFILISGFVDIIPGPAIIFILMQSAFGFRYVLFGIAGLLTANLVWISLAATGLGVVLSQSPIAFEILRWCGAAYLAYIGMKIIKNGISKPLPPKNGKQTSCTRVFLQGLFVSFSNPKSLLFYLALLPNFITQENYLNNFVYFGSIKLLCIFVVMFTYGIIGMRLFSYIEKSRTITAVFRSFGIGIVLAAVAIARG